MTDVITKVPADPQYGVSPLQLILPLLLWQRQVEQHQLEWLALRSPRAEKEAPNEAPNEF